MCMQQYKSIGLFYVKTLHVKVFSAVSGYAIQSYILLCARERARVCETEYKLKFVFKFI